MESVFFPLVFVAVVYSHFRTRFDELTALGLSLALGVLLYTWVALAGYWFFNLAVGFWLANVVSVIAVLALVLQKRFRLPDFRETLTEHKPFFVFLVLAGLFFSYLFYTHFLEPKPDGLYSAGNVWGDLAFHLTTITYFLHGVGFPPAYIIFPSVLGYPFLSSFLTATLAQGASIQTALIAPSLLLLLSFLILTYTIGLRLGFSKSASIVGITLILFSGGLGFIEFFQRALSDGVAVSLAAKDYTILVPTAWTNVMTSLLLPQRSFLFGVAVFTAVFLLFLSANEKRDYILAGTFAGLMPLVNWHSYLVIQGTSVLYAFLYREKQAAYYFLPSVLLAVPQALWSLQQLTPASFIRFQPFWLANTLDPVTTVTFWTTQSGLWIPLATAGVVFAAASMRKRFMPFALLFFLALFFVFQPYAYDNLKFFFYVQWMAAFFIGAFLVAIYYKNVLFRGLAVLLFLSLTLSGSLSVLRETTLHWQLFSLEDLELAEWAKNTKKHAVFLTSTQHNNPIPALAGRRVVLGYEGWLWSHGFDYTKTKSDARRMFSGQESLLNAYNVSYVVISQGARAEYQVNEPFFKSYPVVFQNGAYTVYDISKSR